VINVFILDFHSRLKAWRELRLSLIGQSTEQICKKTDEFWQQCPVAGYYLHPDDIEKWPDPWQLLNDNIYCDYSKALGMIYTLLLLGVEDVEFVEATDYSNNDVVLVLVDCAKYVMNYWPDTIVNTTLSDFKIKKNINIDSLKESVKAFIDE